MKLNKNQLEYAIKRHKDGMTYAKICKDFGISETSLSSQLINYGYRVYSKSPRTRNNNNANISDKNLMVAEALSGDMPLDIIYKKFNVTYPDFMYTLNLICDAPMSIYSMIVNTCKYFGMNGMKKLYPTITDRPVEKCLKAYKIYESKYKKYYTPRLPYDEIIDDFITAKKSMRQIAKYYDLTLQKVTEILHHKLNITNLCAVKYNAVILAYKNKHDIATICRLSHTSKTITNSYISMYEFYMSNKSNKNEQITIDEYIDSVDKNNNISTSDKEDKDIHLIKSIIDSKKIKDKTINIVMDEFDSDIYDRGYIYALIKKCMNCILDK